MFKKPIKLLYTLKKSLPNQAILHSRWGWNTHRVYYRREFINLLEESNTKKIKAFELELRYNTKHDCDNLAPFAKFFVDSLRDANLVLNDTPEFYKSLKLIPDKTLPKKTIQFTIIPHDN